MNKKLYKGNNGMISGVCDGIADYFGVDATIVRIVYLLASIGSLGTGFIVYLVLAWIIPTKPYNGNGGYDDHSNHYNQNQ